MITLGDSPSKVEKMTIDTTQHAQSLE